MSSWAKAQVTRLTTGVCFYIVDVREKARKPDVTQEVMQA